MKDLTYRPDLAATRHTITVELLTAALRLDSDAPAAATQVIVERHSGRASKFCGTDLDVDTDLFPTLTIEQVAQGIAHTYGATYVQAPSTVIATVPARNGLVGFKVHLLRPGAPLPGGHHIAHVEDYGSDTHLVVVGNDGHERCLHRHTEIRELESGVVQLITPAYAGWACD